MTTNQAMIEDELLAWGFSYTPQLGSYPLIPAFQKVYPTKIGNFKVQIPLEDVSLLKLSKPVLKELPEILSNVRLPHLEGNRTICLFDETTKNVDPLNPRAVISACLTQLQNIIDGWVSGSNHEDIAMEFSSYWEPECTCFLLSENINRQLYYYDRRSMSGKIHTEYVISDCIAQSTEWSNKRYREKDSSVPKELCKVLTIKVNSSFFIPFEQAWPPKSLGEIFDWLGKIDTRATSSLFDKLRNEAKEHSTFMVVFTSKSINVAIKFSLTLMGKAALGVNLPKKKKAHHKLHVSALTKRHCVKSFQRFRVDNATQEYIYTRNNLTISTLKDKRVCVIGCGTIGGYLAQGLVQFGAGSGRGTLSLYDNDILKTGNLGRHVLGIQYLDENKSEALTHFLSHQSLISSICSREAFSEEDIERGWDLIVDATGDQSFSILLSRWYRQLTSKSTTRNVILLHSWISGFGHQAKSLLDDGTGACFACLFDYTANPRKDRYPSYSHKKTPDVSTVFKRTCGESHLPFGPEASMTAASLALRLLKQEQTTKLNYLQKSLSELPISYSEKQLKSMRSCPICQ